MGTRKKVLDILIDESQVKEIEEHLEKGHNIHTMDFSKYDLVLGKKCWRIHEKLYKFAKVAITAVKKEKG